MSLLLLFILSIWGGFFAHQTITEPTITEPTITEPTITEPTIIQGYNPRPVVIMHGILANASNMDEFSNAISTRFNKKVYNMEIGNGSLTSIFTPMNEQLSILCDNIYAIDDLVNGFDFIGMSQGGLLARGYVEKCNKYPVHNLITLVSPHGGVFEFKFLFNIILNKFINMYSPEIQSKISFSNYWRDPMRYLLYLKNSTYLSKLNNERLFVDRLHNINDNIGSDDDADDRVDDNTDDDADDDADDVVDDNTDANTYDTDANNTYTDTNIELDFESTTNKQNIMSLKNFVMVYSSNDKVLQPKESGKFSFYDHMFRVINLFDTNLYKYDWLGLKALNDSNRLWAYETTCAHTDHSKPICFDQIMPILQKFLVD
jgi:pimeloyl-ACP methyl ester carboxylesterase